MWNKISGAIALLAALLLLSVPALAAEPEETAEETPLTETAEAEEGTAEEADEPALPCVELRLRSEEGTHTAYMRGYGDHTFRPDAIISRAEAAQVLFGLLEETETPQLAYEDVSADAWYYDAVNTLVCGGVMERSGGSIRPDGEITRGEFVCMAACFAPEAGEEPAFEGELAFFDVGPDEPLSSAVAAAVAAGWVQGYGDGSFRPDKPLTRAEVTVIVNSMRGGTADSDYTHGLILSPFDDVLPGDWAYDYILEASITHEVGEPTEDGGEVWTGQDESVLLREPGLRFLGVEQYCIGEDGRPLTDTTANGLYYGADGRYTCGDPELDALVKNAMKSFVGDGMSREEKLRAAYVYTRDSFTYLRRNYYAMGDNSYTEQEATTMLTTGKGNCYCFAGVFYYMSRQLGFNATPISGTVGHSASPHGWVEIDFDGTTYIFDTELEMSYRAKGVYYYDFYKMSYSAIPWPYRK